MSISEQLTIKAKNENSFKILSTSMLNNKRPIKENASNDDLKALSS